MAGTGHRGLGWAEDGAFSLPLGAVGPAPVSSKFQGNPLTLALCSYFRVALLPSSADVSCLFRTKVHPATECILFNDVFRVAISQTALQQKTLRVDLCSVSRHRSEECLVGHFPGPVTTEGPGWGVFGEELSRRLCAGPDTPQIRPGPRAQQRCSRFFYLKRGLLVFILLFKTSQFCLFIVIFCKICLPFCPVTSAMMITLKHAHYSQHESCAGRFVHIISFNPHDGLREEVRVPLFFQKRW